MSEAKMRVKYFKEKIFDFEKDYNKFIKRCYKEFEMSDEEKNSLKIFIINDNDEMEIEKEEDFKDNLDALNDKNELVCILKSNGRKKKPNKNLDTFEFSNIESKINNSEQLNLGNIKFPEIDYSKITELIQLESEKLRNEILKEINVTNENLAKEIQKKVKRGINDIKAFLTGLGKEINDLKNLENSKENILNIQNNENEELNKQFLENAKKERNENLNSSVKKISEFEKQINTLNEKINKITEEIHNQNKFIQDKKEEKEKILEAKFLDGNYIFSYYYEDLTKMKNLTFNIKILNNGTLTWEPKTILIQGESEEKNLVFNEYINPDEEILPNQIIEKEIKLNLKNIKNQNFEYNLPLKLFYSDNNINQNQFKFKLIVKMSNERKKNLNIIKSFDIKNLKDSNEKNLIQNEKISKNEKKENQNFNNENNNNFNNNKKKKRNSSNGDVDEKDEEIENNFKKNITKKKQSNKKQDLIKKYFIRIKTNLEEDYKYSNKGWDDEELESKIREYLTSDIEDLLLEDEMIGIKTIVEKIGEDILI